jgi:hypothetical protein
MTHPVMVNHTCGISSHTACLASTGQCAVHLSSNVCDLNFHVSCCLCCKLPIMSNQVQCTLCIMQSAAMTTTTKQERGKARHVPGMPLPTLIQHCLFEAFLLNACLYTSVCWLFCLFCVDCFGLAFCLY